MNTETDTTQEGGDALIDQNRLVMQMWAIWVMGADYDGPAAIFKDPQEASDWGTENHFGNWMRFPCEVPMFDYDEFA